MYFKRYHRVLCSGSQLLEHQESGLFSQNCKMHRVGWLASQLREEASILWLEKLKINISPLWLRFALSRAGVEILRNGVIAKLQTRTFSSEALQFCDRSIRLIYITPALHLQWMIEQLQATRTGRNCNPSFFSSKCQILTVVGCGVNNIWRREWG